MKRCPTWSEGATQLLEQWFEQHIHHPYLTKKEKESLAEQTGLSAKQVSTWFANTRRRRKHEPAVRTDDFEIYVLLVE